MSEGGGRAAVLFVGPLPPPRNGMTGVTATLLQSDLGTRFRLVHVDTSDHRDIAKVARVDLTNAWLAAWHGTVFLFRLVTTRPQLVYVPIARNRLGFLRDCAFLVPARLARMPVLVHFHSRAFSDYWRSEPGWMRSLIRFALGPTTHAIALGERLRDGFEPLVPAERVHVVPNGIPDVGPGGAAGDRAPVVLHLSTLYADKGLFDVLAVAARVRDDHPDARFVLAGPWYSEPDRLRAEQLVRRDGLQDVVRFVGNVEGDEKDALLRSAALMLFPSRHEGQPLVVLEAMAAGTPVVATDVGAVPETIRDGREGFLAPVGDVATLAERTSQLLRDRELRSRLGAAARERFEQRYTAAAFAQRLGDVFELLTR